MHNLAVDAQRKADDMTEKMNLMNFFQRNYKLCLSYKLIEKEDPLSLEMAYRMAFLERRFYLASLAIQACYRGLCARRFTSREIGKRRWATRYI